MEDIRELIDIDAELQAMDEDPTVLIELPNGAFLELLIDVPKQIRLKQKYVKPGKFKLDSATFEMFQELRKEVGGDPTPEQIENAIKGRDAEFNLEVDEGNQDFYGFGVSLADFFTGWRGIKGQFSKQKAKAWIQRKPGIAESIGRQFDRILAQYSEKHTRKVEVEEKN